MNLQRWSATPKSPKNTFKTRAKSLGSLGFKNTHIYRNMNSPSTLEDKFMEKLKRNQSIITAEALSDVQRVVFGNKRLNKAIKDQILK